MELLREQGSALGGSNAKQPWGFAGDEDAGEDDVSDADDQEDWGGEEDADEDADEDTAGDAAVAHVEADGGRDSKAQAAAEVQRLLSGSNREPTLGDLEATFPHPLDRVQKRAIQVFLGGASVVVCAPTGAGKTAIAEAAALAVLARGQRVIYTTPLKALSNQKLFEMRARFGAERAGLQTGDVSVAVDADVVVMTTEVLRNIMFRVGDPATGLRGAEERLANVGLIVLDEVHYLGDPSRGSVWEEVVINCLPEIRLLGMSATVANAKDLGGWIDQVHGNCQTVVTRHRPVPLTWHFCQSVDGKTQLVHLLDRTGKQLNPALFPEGAGASDRPDWRNGWQRQAAALATRAERVPAQEAVLGALAARDMLPAIWFIFSRAACDRAAAATTAGAPLAGPDERAQISAEVDALRREQPEAVREALVPALLAGAASHHAGALPGWKSLVEGLFQRGLLKVVFATETLAAGINMPARSTVLSTISRRRNAAHALLQHNELLQMAGRAGRRGYDTIGHCVIVQSRWEEASQAAGLLLAGPEPLRSRFGVGFGTALNLLATRSLAEARAFVQRSFANYLGGAGVRRQLREIEQLEAKADALAVDAAQAEAAAGGAGEAAKALEKASGAFREERRAFRLLRQQAIAGRAERALETLDEGGLPRMVVLDLTGADIDALEPLAALVVAAADSPGNDLPPAAPAGQHATKDAAADADRWLLCLASDNRLLWVRGTHLAGVAVGALGAVDGGATALAVMKAAGQAAAWAFMKGGFYTCAGTAVTAVLATRVPPPANATEVELGEGELEALEAAQERTAAKKKAAKSAQLATATKKTTRRDLQLRGKVEALRRRAAALHHEMEGSLGVGGREFEDVVGVLVAAGALDPDTLAPRPLGEAARQLSGENELWLATVLSDPAVQTLKAAQLAGLACAMVSAEAVSKPQISAAYAPSEAVVEAVRALEGARSALFDLQADAGVHVPLAVDLRLAGLSGVVEAWAAGGSWAQVTADSNLDDGDIMRLLNRTSDLLRQAGFCTALPSPVRKESRRAAHAMNRAPISELLSL
ncbi:hypothetical protein WJX81_003415 [Elliptochloris bilobata]|uniref:Helicase ATP-binding domain-containing protein n=1 Tax=Elliptochloris bilobata TaxID=381761 RepID=A0AAW1SK34_9CHLO